MARPIRIAFFIDNFQVGGTELHAVRLAERMVRDGHAVHVVHLHADGPLRQRYASLGIPMLHTPIPRIASADSIRQGRNVVRALRRWDIDIALSHDVYCNILGTIWARIAGVPTIISSRRWWDSLPRPGLARLNRWSYQFATAVIANSSSVGELLVRAERVPLGKVLIQQNSVEDSAYKLLDAPDRLAWKRALGLPTETLLVGSVGRLTAVKNTKLLIDAAHQLHQKGVAFTLALVGAGPEQVDLRNQIRQLGADDYARLLGQLASRPLPQQLFDVAVSASRSEGSPNSLIEAMVSGVPVVATRVGGVSDAVRDGIDGFLVASDNTTEFAGALERLLLDSQLRRSMGASARVRAYSEFHEDAVTSKLYDDLYRWVR
jgi:glycosyltransferase involved in cell wall biosynthesis